MPALTIPANQQASVLAGVATKYGIPLQALLGIYGTETAFGRNVTTSSAGAVGPFQFIPSTAAQYGYPQTNTPSLAQFAQQADAWGRYLVANNPSKSASGWAPAMRGGYTEAQAEAKIANIPANLKSAIAAVVGGGFLNNQPAVPGTSVGPGPGTVGSIDPLAGVAGAITSVWDAATSGTLWLKVLKFIGGAILLYMGLHGLTGAGPSVGDVAKHAVPA